MNGLLLQLYCAEILGVLLFIPGCTAAVTASQDGTDATSSASLATSLPDLTMSETSRLMTTKSPESVSQFSTRQSTSPRTQSTTTPTPTSTTTSTTTTTTTTAAPFWRAYREQCPTVLLLSSGLIIACTVLLISTLLLAWKVCQLSRRLKTLSSNADLISTNEYWMGTATKNKKSKSDTEAKETSVLLSDLNQTQEEMNNGTTKEGGGEVNENGQKGEEEEAGDTAKTEEASTAPVTVEEKSSSSEPQGEATISQSTKAEAASPSEGAEKPKNGP